jgi:DNA-binding response OmpR family regulator
MPEEDGIELMLKLRLRRHDLPVVAISVGGTLSNVSVLRVAAALGAGAMLHKPFSADELVTAIRHVLKVVG